MLKEESRISESDRALILEYVSKLESRGISVGRLAKYIYYLKNIRIKMKANFSDVTRVDIETLVKEINSENYEPWTRADYKGILKSFYRWLRTGAMDSSAPFPPEVAWINSKISATRKKSPMC